MQQLVGWLVGIVGCSSCNHHGVDLLWCTVSSETMSGYKQATPLSISLWLCSNESTCQQSACKSKGIIKKQCCQRRGFCGPLVPSFTAGCHIACLLPACLAVGH
jgi:hypothetical protein